MCIRHELSYTLINTYNVDYRMFRYEYLTSFHMRNQVCDQNG